MRTNLLQKNPLRCKTFALALLLGASAATGCDKEKDFSRSNTLYVFTDPVTQAPVDQVQFRVTGGTSSLFIRSNVDFNTTFRTSDEEQRNWVTLQRKGWNDQMQAMEYLVTALPSKAETYAKRTGTLSFSYPQDYLGQFITTSQGFSTRISEKFDWLNTGSAIPFDPTGEKAFASWTQAQKDHGWSSPLLPGQARSYLYSKKGYVKLGDGTHGAQLQTHDLAKMAGDSIIMFTFKALAYVSSTGEKDNNLLSLRIEEGGKFRDGSKQVTIEVPHYDHTDPNLVENMWKGTMQKFFLVTDKNEKFTANTRLIFSTPDEMNRIFIYDVNAYIIDRESLYVLDEDENQTQSN